MECTLKGVPFVTKLFTEFFYSGSVNGVILISVGNVKFQNMFE